MTEDTKSLRTQRRGIIFSSAGAICFGFIPLFSVPLMRMGLLAPSILFYRFSFAALLLFPILLLRRISLRVRMKEVFLMLALAALFMCSALGLQIGYRYMSTGLATVIHFNFPLFVVFLSFVFFKEKPTIFTQIGVVLSLIGVALIAGIGQKQGAQSVPFEGFFIVLATALSYGAYLLLVQRSSLHKLDSMLLTCYVLSFCAIGYAVLASFWGGLQPLPSLEGLGLAFCLALIPTVASNLLLVHGVKGCGSTTSSILGSLEPFTAVTIGILLFGEALMPRHLVGMFFILSAIVVSALSKKRLRSQTRQLVHFDA